MMKEKAIKPAANESEGIDLIPNTFPNPTYDKTKNSTRRGKCMSGTKNRERPIPPARKPVGQDRTRGRVENENMQKMRLQLAYSL